MKNSYDRYEFPWHEFTQWEFIWREFIWYYKVIYTMMLVLSPLTGTATSSCKPPFYVDYAKMALPLTRSSVNGPSVKLTGLDNGLHHEVYTLEKEHQCHTPHGLTLQCHRTVHVHWLYELLLDMSPSCAHISLNRWPINPVWQPISWTDKIQKHL